MSAFTRQLKMMSESFPELDPGPDPVPVASPIIGYRLWAIEPPPAGNEMVSADDLATMRERWKHGLDPFAPILSAKLRGVGVHHVWPPGHEFHASCNRGAHPAPNWKCECGIWAFKHRESMYAKLAGLHPQQEIAYGEVEMWGRIVETTGGYRAEYAHPVWVNLINTDEATANALGELYECSASSVRFPDEAVLILMKRHFRARAQDRRGDPLLARWLKQQMPLPADIPLAFTKSIAVRMPPPNPPSRRPVIENAITAGLLVMGLMMALVWAASGLFTPMLLSLLSSAALLIWGVYLSAYKPVRGGKDD